VAGNNHPNRSRKELRVWSVSDDGRRSLIVAARSQKHAAELMGVTLSRLRDYGSVTANDVQVATATAEPGTVFTRRIGDWSDVWTRLPQASRPS